MNDNVVVDAVWFDKNKTLDIWEIVIFPFRVTLTFPPVSVVTAIVFPVGAGEGFGVGDTEAVGVGEGVGMGVVVGVGVGEGKGETKLNETSSHNAVPAPAWKSNKNHSDLVSEGFVGKVNTGLWKNVQSCVPFTNPIVFTFPSSGVTPLEST